MEEASNEKEFQSKYNLCLKIVSYKCLKTVQVF